MYSRKDIWSIALPILISLFVQNLINIIDTAFMGRVGQVELGASALAGVFYLAFYMVIFGFSTGAQILMARRNGERKYQALGPIMGQGTLFLVFFSILLVGASLVWTPRLLDLLISSPAVCKAGEDYMEYRIFGLIFTSIGVMFRAFFVAITRTRVLMVNAIIMTVANVVFNYIFVFGNFGAPQMGIAGAALGSVLAEASAALHFFLYTLFCIDREKYQLSRVRFENFALIREILNVSVWSMILYFLTIAMVPLLRSRRASGRTAAGHLEHHTQHLYPAVHAGQCLRRYRLHPREQRHGGPPRRRCDTHHQAHYQDVLHHCGTPHRPAVHLPRVDSAHLYQRQHPHRKLYGLDLRDDHLLHAGPAG